MKRRSFLMKSSAAAFGFQVVGSHVLKAAKGGNTPNGKIRIAAIGVGGRGGANLGAMAGEEIVALCDVDDRRAAHSFKKFPKAKRFRDFRKMYDQMGDQIDAVLVATPDHTHAVQIMGAIGRGKHVYSEKPLAHSVAEVRTLQKAAKEKGVITQVGNQGHSSEHIRLFCEMVWAGAIGNVSEIHCGCDAFKNVYCQIDKQKAIETEEHEVPEGLDWDLWLGPAADRAYNPAYLPFNWRGFSAFGSGCIGDWVCHVVDPSYWAFDLGMPIAVTADTKGYDPKKHSEFYPKGCRITYEFPAKGERGPVKLVWYDGDYSIPQPDELTAEKRKVVGTGAVVIGDQGKIMHGSHGAGGCRIIPESKMREFGKPNKSIPRIKGSHQSDWLNAIRAGKEAGSPFSYGGALSEIGLLGMIAIQRTWGSKGGDRTGLRLEWDSEKMKFTNDDEANKLVNPPYRTGWKL